MSKQILLLQRHPGASPPRWYQAMVFSDNVGCQSTGRSVEQVSVSEHDFALLRHQNDFNSGSPSSRVMTAPNEWLRAKPVVFFSSLDLGQCMRHG